MSPMPRPAEPQGSDELWSVTAEMTVELDEKGVEEARDMWAKIVPNGTLDYDPETSRLTVRHPRIAAERVTEAMEQFPPYKYFLFGYFRDADLVIDQMTVTKSGLKSRPTGEG